MIKGLKGRSLYEILGITDSATKKEIRKAFHNKSKDTHPDKEGGDEEEFKLVNTAYQILIDDVARERYDFTGEQKQTPFEEKFASYIQHFFVEIVNRTNDVTTKNILKGFTVTLIESEKEVMKQFKKVEHQENNVRKMKLFLERLERKGDGQDMIRNMFEINIKNLSEQNKKNRYQLNEELEFLEQAREILDTYKYNVDPEKTFDDMLSQSIMGNNKISWQDF